MVNRTLLVYFCERNRELKFPFAFNDEVYTGEYVTFYLPDMKKEAVEEGDIVRAEHITCDPKKTR